MRSKSWREERENGTGVTPQPVQKCLLFPFWFRRKQEVRRVGRARRKESVGLLIIKWMGHAGQRSGLDTALHWGPSGPFHWLQRPGGQPHLPVSRSDDMTHHLGLLRSQGFPTGEAFGAKPGKILGKPTQGSHHRAVTLCLTPYGREGLIGFERRRGKNGSRKQRPGLLGVGLLSVWDLSPVSVSCRRQLVQRAEGVGMREQGRELP